MKGRPTCYLIPDTCYQLRMYAQLSEAQEQGFLAHALKVDDGLGGVALGVHLGHSAKPELRMLYAHARL